MPSLLPALKQLSAPYQLEPIAMHLVDSILNYQKEGPYYLGGWSASGVVAYETARQLMEKGHEVALLVMFDTENPAFQRNSPQAGWLRSRANKVKFHIQELLGLELNDSPVYIAEKAKELRRRIGNAAWQSRYKIQLRMKGGRLENHPDQIVQLAVDSYRPAPYFGRLAFFKAAEGPSGDAWDCSRGWPHLVTGEFKVHEVPGDHRSMFHEPNVETLANKMVNYFCSEASGQ
jgi:thioesterase domain-containing protein